MKTLFQISALVGIVVGAFMIHPGVGVLVLCGGILWFLENV